MRLLQRARANDAFPRECGAGAHRRLTRGARGRVDCLTIFSVLHCTGSSSWEGTAIRQWPLVLVVGRCTCSWQLEEGRVQAREGECKHEKESASRRRRVQAGEGECKQEQEEAAEERCC